MPSELIKKSWHWQRRTNSIIYYSILYSLFLRFRSFVCSSTVSNWLQANSRASRIHTPHFYLCSNKLVAFVHLLSFAAAEFFSISFLGSAMKKKNKSKGISVSVDSRVEQQMHFSPPYGANEKNIQKSIANLVFGKGNFEHWIGILRSTIQFFTIQASQHSLCSLLIL